VQILLFETLFPKLQQVQLVSLKEWTSTKTLMQLFPGSKTNYAEELFSLVIFQKIRKIRLGTSSTCEVQSQTQNLSVFPTWQEISFWSTVSSDHPNRFENESLGNSFSVEQSCWNGFGCKQWVLHSHLLQLLEECWWTCSWCEI